MKCYLQHFRLKIYISEFWVYIASYDLDYSKNIYMLLSFKFLLRRFKFLAYVELYVLDISKEIYSFQDLT